MDGGKDWSHLSTASENKYLVLKRQVAFRIMEELDAAHRVHTNGAGPSRTYVFIFYLDLGTFG